MSDYDKKTAKIYDSILFLFIHPLRRKIRKIIQNNNFNNILDVCCGTGNQLKYLKKKGIEATGIDLSPDMLEVAKSARVNCFEQNAEGMNFDNDSYDLVMTSFALHEKSHESAAMIIKEMLRVCKPGGHILLADYSLPRYKFDPSRKVVNYIEYIAGEEHYGFYKAYLHSGGLDHLVEPHKLREVQRWKSLMGNVEIRLLQLI